MSQRSSPRWSKRAALTLVPVLTACLGCYLWAEALESQGGATKAADCAACHEEAAASYAVSSHGRSGREDWDGRQDCETCHGPGAEHGEGGDQSKIMNPGARKGAAANESCLSCHAGDAAAHWRGNSHEARDVRCADCHKIHQPWERDQALANIDINETCLSCHKNQRKHMFQRSSHSLRDGRMSCASCHDPHGSAAESAVAAASPNDLCYQCHADKRGPFLWEHAPVRENCMSCHEPHGSNQTNMLVRSAPRLCQSCHLLGHHQTVPGTPRQVWNVNRSCVNCHSQIHGSNHPAGIVLMR